MEAEDKQISDEEPEEPEEPDLYDVLTKDISEGIKFEKMSQFDSLRDGIDLIFEGGAIKDFFYDEFPELSPSAKD